MAFEVEDESLDNFEEFIKNYIRADSKCDEEEFLAIELKRTYKMMKTTELKDEEDRPNWMHVENITVLRGRWRNYQISHNL
jgi:predicted transcriptional regulator